jgi:NADPH2:quinone reductase
MTWGVGGWLLGSFLAKIGPERAQELRLRVASSLKSTFASHYAGEISLFEALDPSVIVAYRGIATGAKYVINPSKAR